MKIVITLLLTSMFHFHSVAITMYLSGDTLVNWAKGGLNIRIDKKLSSKKIGLIPYGEKVVVQESKINRWNDKIDVVLIPKVDIKGVDNSSYILNGRWVKVKFANQIGYAFDGYLSKYSAPKFLRYQNADRLEPLDKYLEREFGIVSKIKDKYVVGEDAVFNLIEFKGGVLEQKIASKTAYVKYVLPDFSLEEIMLYMKYSVFINVEKENNIITKNYIDSENNFRKITIAPSLETNSIINIAYFEGVVILEYEAWC